jgi:subtilisin family serine protease
MMNQTRVSPLAFAAAFLVVSTLALAAQAPSSAAKRKVNSATDLPRFSYPVSGPPSALLLADDATFNAFAMKVMHDDDSVLNGYDIEDKATLRDLYSLKLDVQVLTHNDKGALSTLKTLQALQEKPEAQATFGLLAYPVIEARVASHSASGDAYEKAFHIRFKARVDSLRWRLVQDTVKEEKGSFEFATKDFIVGDVKESIDPAALKSGTIDMAAAETLVSDRFFITIALPLKNLVLPVLTTYIADHNVLKPDIWEAREVTLTADQKLTPVHIGIWDSGVDTSLFPDQIFTDPDPGAHSPHGLAYDMHGELYNGDLQPLTPEQKELYPKVLGLAQGVNDLMSAIDSPAASEAKKTIASMSPDQVAPFMKQMGFLSQWMHGTHVAGIATRGNPAARIVVAQFYDSLAEIPFPPTAEWANKFKADFQQIGEYFRTNNVRVVNLSWGDNVSEIEQWLTKTSAEKDPAARKQIAATIYSIWREAIENAMRSAPNTLFVCAAGNSDSNAGFTEDVPAALHLPNLITVGAVDQAGEETSFTSYGNTVVVDADGFQVESYVPGGTRIKFSGTSMASPNVVNLAAKLIALDSSLTPEKTIALIKQGAEKSADGRRNLINPKATVALLMQQRTPDSSR